MHSIDWLTLYQEHPDAAKFGGETILYADFETGNVKREVIRGFVHDGSFDSRILVRGDGRGIEVSGNPSRWCREDNLFGFSSISACIEKVYNPILHDLGLPVFFTDGRTHAAQGLRQGDRGVMDCGVIARRVDLCQNYSAVCSGQNGMDSSRQLLRYLAQAVHQGKPGNTYPNGATVDWNRGSRFTYFKYYLKAVELEKGRSKRSDYLLELIEWCRSVGLVRHEVSLKSQFLRKSSLFDIGLWGADMYGKILDSYAPHKRLGYSSGVNQIYSELMSEGVPKYRAAKAQREVYAYLAGENLRSCMTSSSFYRLRSDLLLVGIDIAAPLNVSALSVRVRPIDLSPVEIPSFYRGVG